MFQPFPPAAIDALTARGWKDLGAEETSMSLEHLFEDEDRALQVKLVSNRAYGLAAHISAQIFRPNSRKRYAVTPPVYDTYADARAAAEALRDELQFLTEHGVKFKYARMYRLTSNGQAGGNQVHDGIYIGERISK